MDRKKAGALAAIAAVAGIAAAIGIASCSGGEQKPDKAPKDAKAQKADSKATAEAPKPVQDCIMGDPAESLLLAQAWFYKQNNRPVPGPARLLLWRKTAEGWKSHKLEDPDSNVFHKVILEKDGSLLTAAGEKAKLKRWTRGTDGCWKGETLWENAWGGRFNRLRDIEIGDVDGDGKDEFVIATHDSGVIAVYNPPETEGGQPEVIELDKKADTFVHEIEIGDIDGDGRMEFFATPSDRNQANQSQAGEIVMYKWDGSTYKRTVVDGGEHTHAKEILATDIDGDGKHEFLSVLEAEMENKQIKQPVKIRLYRPNADGSFAHEDIATIDDQQTRFLVPGDFDGDGRQELVAAAMKTGLYIIDSENGSSWTINKFDAISSGFEHASVAQDLDGDGRPELYVAADDQRELKRYVWNPQTKTFDKEVIGRYDDDTFTWNIAGGKF